MAILRHWWLIALLLVVGGGPLLAASTREERALNAAQLTFNDKIFDRAETELTQFIKNYPRSANVPMAALLLAQAQFKQQKYAAALQTLADYRDNAGGLADKFAYWTGEAQFQTNGFAPAAESFAAVVKNFPESALRLAAAVEAAAAWEKTGDWNKISALLGDAGGVFQRAAQTNAGGEPIINGRLLLARALSAQKEFGASTAVLAALPGPKLQPEQRWKKDSLLFANNMAAGETAAAMALTTNLLELARSETNADWLADAVAKRGAVQEAMGLLTEAARTFRDSLSTNAPIEKQREAILKYAALAAAQNDFTNATAALEKFLNTTPDPAVADLVRLTLGELHLKDPATNRLAQAQAQFDRLLEGSPASGLAGKAHLGRGWVFWLAEKYEPALADFKAAMARLPVTNDLAVAIFKAADSELMLKQYAAARNDYRLLLQKFAGQPSVLNALGDRALYQMVRASLELKDRAGAEAALQQLLARSPENRVAESSLLLTAESFSDFSSPASARDLLRQFLENSPASPLRAEASFVLARTFEREQNWPAAITNHDAWLKNFPTNVLRPQVAYAQAWANVQAGRETNAFLLFSNFVAQFPANTNAPLAQWWLADKLYRDRAFGEAERNYEVIYQTDAWKGSPLFYKAQLMAGRAAMALQGYKDAEAHFVPLINSNPLPSELGTQARFAYGALLMQMPSADTNNPLANLTTAVIIYDQVFKAYPTNDPGLRARGEMANCARMLGDFSLATNAYLQVAGAPAADAALRAQALVGLGLTYETIAASLPPDQRKPFLERAKNTYLDVVDAATNPEREDLQDERWVKKAGLAVLPLLNTTDNGHTNFFNRLEILLPQLRETLEKKRAALTAVKN
jgi:TolA-binding protein